jgi:hypothetical protein
MTDEHQGTRPDDLATRAGDLARRAQELAADAGDAVAAEEELRRLDEQLAELEAEARRLDEGLDGEADGDGFDEEPAEGWRRTGEWLGPLGRDLESLFGGLGDRIRESLATSGMPLGEPDERRAALAPGRRVRVVVHGGVLRVRPGAEGQMVAKARSVLRPGGRQRTSVLLVDETDDDELVVAVRSRGFGRRGSAVLDVEIPVHTELHVVSGGGLVDVSGTHAPVSVRAGGGGVRVDGATDVSVTTGGGIIRIANADGSVQARTGGGGVRVMGRLRGDSSISTGGGTINVQLQPGSNIAVAARGSIVSTNLPGLQVSRTRLDGRVGSGEDGRLTIRTGGGSVAVRSSS